MNQAFRILAAATVAALAGCSSTPLALRADEQQDVARVATYLDGLKSFRAAFTQTGAFGEGSGTVWLDRPGKLRIAYAGEAAKTLVAARGRVVIYDAASGGTTTMPVSRTPLGMLLTPSITLTGDVTVTGYHADGNTEAVSIQKTESPGDGSLTMYLSRTPLALIGVLVKDGYQRPSMIQLSDLQRDPPLALDLFQYPAPPPGS